MNNHQSLKAEIDARGDNFSACIALGKELLSRGHYATPEIKEKLVTLTNQRNSMLHRWEERWEHLQLILEVYQFARDAAVAEGWLMAQESYLMSHELGHTIDEVENLIKKHEAFEKSAAAQEERFAALERLTTYELKELKRRQEEEERIRAEELAAQQAALASLHSPPEGSHPDQTDGDTSPSEPVSASTEKEPVTEASEERRSSTAGGEDSYEGTVNRKHEWESTTKKSSNRSWDKIYLVLRNGELAVYKDQKTARGTPEAHYRNEAPINIRSATAEVAADYTKKRHVFRLKLSNGGEYLFQAKDDEEMNGWVMKLQNFTVSEGAGPSRAQTLPAHAAKEEPKRRSFFTLKKK
jgi:spectrin beta